MIKNSKLYKFIISRTKAQKTPHHKVTSSASPFFLSIFLFFLICILISFFKQEDILLENSISLNDKFIVCEEITFKKKKKFNLHIKEPLINSGKFILFLFSLINTFTFLIKLIIIFFNYYLYFFKEYYINDLGIFNIILLPYEILNINNTYVGWYM